MANGILRWNRIISSFWPFILLVLFACVFTQVSIARDSRPQEIRVPKKLLKSLKSFEPSAALYLPETNNYVIASDDTDKHDSAMLFLMNAQGEVSKAPLTIDGVETMTDIESLSAENGYLYALSSQSRNKKGKDLQERNLFVRSKLERETLTGGEVMELRPLLLKALGQSRDPRLQSMKSKYDKQLEIEASFVRGGRLFVGLKDPQPRPGVAMVLDLGDVNTMFRDHSLGEVKVALELDFGGNHKLSDMISMNGRLLLTSTLEDGGGSLWEMSTKDGKLRETQTYDQERPEGISAGDQNGLLVVFDQGEDKALFTHERL